MKTFIAISSEIKDRKLVYLATNGYGDLYDENGIAFDVALDFLFSLTRFRKRRAGITVVCFAFSRDNEFIFSTMPRDLKDKLFQSQHIKKELNRIEADNEALDDILYTADSMTDDYLCADFEKYGNNLAVKELTEVAYGAYHIKLINGKILTIRRGKKSLSIYDVRGFFDRDSLRRSVHKWLGVDVEMLDHSTVPDPDTETLKARAQMETVYVSRLAGTVNDALESQGIKLTRFHGASALSSHWLNKMEAKKYYCAYRHRRQLSPELHKASWQAYYGGRAEQFKIGTMRNVNIYDINSAYAFACTLLPVLLQKPRFSETWVPDPFSVWFIDYDFRAVYPYLGYLPNRDASNFTRYKLKGRGYFWQPEVMFCLLNFPQCVEVRHGFTLDYEQAPFADDIRYLYECRRMLQAAGHPLADIFKLALASLYGKFAQYNGKAHYFNLQYAGYITSNTRAQLLTAVKGYEDQTICFQTDAIHTSANLPVPLSRDLGEYKQTRYRRITYLDNGIYVGFNENGQRKAKMRGATHFDFDKAIDELKTRRAYSALSEFFIGHNVFSQHLFTGAEYLEHVKIEKERAPIATQKFASRIFELADFDAVDIDSGYYESRIVDADAGRESALFTRTTFQDSNFGLDTIEARRV